MKLREFLQDNAPRALAWGLTATTAGLAVLACGGAAMAADGSGNQTRGELIVVGSDETAGSLFTVRDDDERELHFGTSHSVEVQIRDGDVVVRINGEDVPAAQVLREDGRFVILDDEGNEIRSINIGQFGDGSDHKIGFHFGDGHDRLWIADGPDVQMVEPKVMIGIHLGQPGTALERHLHLEPGATTMVTAVYEGLPAANAGLDEYDIITKIDGETPADPKALHATIAAKQPGDVLRLQVIHEGSPKDVRVRLTAYDREAMAAAKLHGGDDNVFFSGDVDGQPWFKAIEKLDFTDGVEWNQFFVDDDNRFFQALPRPRIELRRKPGETERNPDGSGGLGPRLDRLDTRLQALEEMLDAILEEAGRKRE